MKQTAVEYLNEQIKIALKLNNVKLNYGYVINTILPVINKAKEIEREQIEQAYCSGSAGNMNDEGNFEQYYNETYKGGEK